MDQSRIGNTAYNKFSALPHFSENCIKYLMENNELIWKLLKYATPDAWQREDLTHEEKAQLIYAGDGDTSNFRVFIDAGQPEVEKERVCIIRIWPYVVTTQNRSVGEISMIFEAYSHYSINTLSNYTTRIDTIIQQFIEVFNGTNIGGIGNLFFDRLGSKEDRAVSAGTIPFRGKYVILTSKV